MRRDGRASVALTDFDSAVTTERLVHGLRRAVSELGRRGAVVAVSGGIDSAVVAALCARALEPRRVLLLRLPEQVDGNRSSLLGLELAARLGTPTREEAIGPVLSALGCYSQQDEAVQAVFPDHQPGWPFKLVRSRPGRSPTYFSLVIERPDGRRESRRMPTAAYRLLLSATNEKQRVRTLISYTWADRLHAVVAGTPNLLEFDQGFFVKGGDGLSDVKPIAGMYKQQVYALGRHLQLPAAILGRQPTTETFSLPQSQEEFYFGYPLEQMDLLLWGERHGVPVDELAARGRLSREEVLAGYAEVVRRRTATAYLHAAPVLLDATQPV
ncbi:MAG: synthetase [Frankiales bacterium]|nr:synthetase [Frankiales bacterium]